MVHHIGLGSKLNTRTKIIFGMKYIYEYIRQTLGSRKYSKKSLIPTGAPGNIFNHTAKNCLLKRANKERKEGGG